MKQSQNNQLPMSKKDREELAKFKIASKKFVAKHTKSKKAAGDYLVKAGIFNKDGTLTKEYQS